MKEVGYRFDVIVVGAGPAGSASAYTLAKKGFKVLLVERGRIPGSKNVFGGRVYADPLREVFDGFDDSAPIHRWVTKERISMVSGDAMTSFEFYMRKNTSFTTYLTELACWMAKKVEEVGGTVLTEITVDELVVENGKVTGIRVGDEKVSSEVVIDAEGINRLLLERAGLVPKLELRHAGLGV
ncbi:MAG: FAD-dependent oxidoreductase, partial [Candidatus Korarchaeota archaeon]|nr:FAD-dependent oxidoreductase [Candidatus Korarchaeota archaeon]